MKLALILISVVASGQTFEVATVKPAAPDGLIPGVPLPLSVLNGPMGDQIRFRQTPGRIDYIGVTLRSLLQRAYDVKPVQISGPGWLDKERYDIVATMAPGTTKEQLRVMLQQLLAERFQMMLHRETKSLPVYLLMVAKGGPKLKPPEPDSESPEEMLAAMKARNQVLDEQSKARAASGDKAPRTGLSNTNGAMASLAETLSREVNRPVRDRTGLQGSYSYRVEFVPESAALSDNGSTGPTIYAALEEQLGLHLQAENEQMDVVVIDKAEKVPTSN